MNHTPYQLLGGKEGVRRLCDAFYDCMDQLPEAADIRRMHGDGGHAEIVRTILLLAQTLGLEVVAEGVELDSQRASLKAMGCDFAQGYLFARPMSPDQADRYLAAWVGLTADAGEAAFPGHGPGGPEDDMALARRQAFASDA